MIGFYFFLILIVSLLKGRTVINRFRREEVQSGAYEHALSLPPSPRAPRHLVPEFIIVLQVRMRFKETADFHSMSTRERVQRFIALSGILFIDIEVT